MFNHFRDIISNTWLAFLIKRIVAMLELQIMGLYHSKDVVKLIKQIVKEDTPILSNPSEVFMVYSLAQKQAALEGDYAEVGVYKGTTAKALCEAKGDKALHLFDTFEGIPKIDKKIDSILKVGIFKSDLELVKAKLNKYKNVSIYKGIFPSTGNPIKDKKFSLVHLDVDAYKSTKDCLDFFYKRLAPGGIIISHDYHLEGVKKAFDEFLSDKPETVIRLPTSQCMILKN